MGATFLADIVWECRSGSGCILHAEVSENIRNLTRRQKRLSSCVGCRDRLLVSKKENNKGKKVTYKKREAGAISQMVS